MYISNLNCSYVSPQKSNKPLTFMTLSPRVQYEIRTRSFFNFDESKKAASPTNSRYGASQGQKFNNDGDNFYSNFKTRSQQSNFRRRYDFEDSESSDDFTSRKDNMEANGFDVLSENSEFSNEEKGKYSDDQNRLKFNQGYSSTFSEEEQEYDSQKSKSSSHSKLSEEEEEEEEYEKQTQKRESKKRDGEIDEQLHSSSRSKLLDEEEEENGQINSSSHSKHFDEENGQINSSSHSKHFDEENGQINSSSHSKHFDEEEEENVQIYSSSHSKHFDEEEEEIDNQIHSSSHSKHESSHSRNSKSSSKRKSKKSQLSDEERHSQLQSCSEEGENNFESSGSRKKKKINNKENKDTTTATMISSSSSKNMSSTKRSRKSSKESSSCAIEVDNSSSAAFSNSQKRNSFQEEETSEHEIEIDEEESVSNRPDNENDSEYNYVEVVDCGVSPLDKDPNMLDERKVKISKLNDSESSETGSRKQKPHSIQSNEENSSSSVSLGKRKVQPRKIERKNGSNSDANDFSSDAEMKHDTMKKLVESNSELVNAAIHNQRAILSTANNEQTRKALEHMQAASELLKKISSELQ